MNETALNSRFNNLTDLTKEKEAKRKRMLLLQNTILNLQLFGLDKWEYLIFLLSGLAIVYQRSCPLIAL